MCEVENHPGRKTSNPLFYILFVVAILNLTKRKWLNGKKNELTSSKNKKRGQ